MQLMWLSGPTADVVTVSIGRRAILTGVLVAALSLVALGGVLQLLGIRIAVDADPSWARMLGGVTSASEQERIEQQYDQQIGQLRARIDGLVQQVNELEAAKNAVVQLVPVDQPRRNWLGGLGGQGGPLDHALDFGWFAPRAVDALVRLDGQSQRLDQRLQSLNRAWQAEQQVLQLLPLRTPVADEHHVSSDFGFRRDPITGGLGRHAGLDYVAAYRSPVRATAAGRVTHAQPLGAYGLAVDVEHEGGFSTRYAHLAEIAVTEGQRIEPGQVLGLLGNTGRSTGPHLHYEVRVDGQPIDPLAPSVLKAAKAQVRSGQLSPVQEP